MTVPYDMPNDLRKALRPHHRAFQAAVAVMANKAAGTSTPTLGIGKCEGGVRVGRWEIAISRSHVIDDWKRTVTPTPEELAVVGAINMAAQIFRDGGAAALEQFLPPDAESWHEPLRDPLRSMFDLWSAE